MNRGEIINLAEGDDPYRVLPHRSVLDCSLYHADGAVIREDYEHAPCGQPLKRADIVEANWCPHCAATINKAAAARGRAHRQNAAGAT